MIPISLMGVLFILSVHSTACIKDLNACQHGHLRLRNKRLITQKDQCVSLQVSLGILSHPGRLLGMVIQVPSLSYKPDEILTKAHLL